MVITLTETFKWRVLVCVKYFKPTCSHLKICQKDQDKFGKEK